MTTAGSPVKNADQSRPTARGEGSLVESSLGFVVVMAQFLDRHVHIEGNSIVVTERAQEKRPDRFRSGRFDHLT
jgi:hypothetical protein